MGILESWRSQRLRAVMKHGNLLINPMPSMDGIVSYIWMLWESYEVHKSLDILAQRFDCKAGPSKKWCPPVRTIENELGKVKHGKTISAFCIVLINVYYTVNGILFDLHPYCGIHLFFFTFRADVHPMRYNCHKSRHCM